MPSRVRALALLSLALVALVAIVAGSAAAPKPKAGHGSKPHHGHHHKQSKPPRSFFGIDSQDQLGDSDYAKMAANGVGVLRAGLYWPLVQSSADAPYDFSYFDSYVEAATKNGLSVLPYLYGTPDWVAHDLDHSTCTSCSTFAPRSADALAAWKAFATAAAARYGPKGTFWTEHTDLPKKPIRTWQVWNEQNYTKFYMPKPSPSGYEKVLAGASQGVRAADSTAKVILGGMFGLPGRGTGEAIPLATFVHKLLKIDGAKKQFDGIALHPYSKLLKSIQEQAEVARKELSKSHDSKAELWITETGAASGGKPDPLNLGSEKAQAKRVSEIYQLFSEHRKQWKVPFVAWFAWQDSHASDSFCSFCARSGLTTEGGADKPALKAYKRAAK